MSGHKFVSNQGLAGFLDLGFVQNGFEMIHRTGTLDFGNPCAEANKHLLGDKWTSSFSDEPNDWELFADARAVVGCPPCSGWSVSSGPANRGPEAKAHAHTRAFMKYVGRIAPEVAVFECVTQAYSQGREVMNQYRAMIEEISGQRYDLHHVTMNNLLVGGSSFRPRYFWVAVQEGLPFSVEAEWPERDRMPTIMDMIGDLEEMPETWEQQPYRFPASEWAQKAISRTGHVDGHTRRNPNIHTQRIDEMFDRMPGGNEGWAQGMDLPTALKKVYDADGELPPSWSNVSPKIIERDFYMGFSQPYRWRSDTWANVLTGGCLDLVIHPTSPRTLTHREAARIQGLPDDWRIKPVRHYSALSLTWGKAVSLDASRWIAKFIKATLDEEKIEGNIKPEQLSEREWYHKADAGFTRTSARKRYYPEARESVNQPRIWQSDEFKAKQQPVAV